MISFEPPVDRTRPRERDLPEEVFHAIYGLVPRLTVEVLLVSDGGVLLTKRRSGPCKGLWHIPGGTVRYGESLADAAARIGLRELGLVLTTHEMIGVIEYPSHLAAGIDWPVGVVIPAVSNGRLNSDDARWFDVLPREMHEEQRSFLEAIDLRTLPHSSR
ncbi:MAG: NUDIX domain-containing protein [Acidimicrobiales bacterium]